MRGLLKTLRLGSNVAKTRPSLPLEIIALRPIVNFEFFLNFTLTLASTSKYEAHKLIEYGVKVNEIEQLKVEITLAKNELKYYPHLFLWFFKQMLVSERSITFNFKDWIGGHTCKLKIHGV